MKRYVLVVCAKVYERAHLNTLHVGVIITMAKLRERFWVPKWYRLVNKYYTISTGVQDSKQSRV